MIKTKGEMNLDKRLREIVFDVAKYGNSVEHGLEPKQAIAQIKQAFEEAGYAKSEIQRAFRRYIDTAIKDAEASIRRKEVLGDLMTGQEWYDRFEKELYKPKPQIPPHQDTNDDGESKDRFFRAGGTNFMYNKALEAAKKAGGLK